MFQIKSNIMKFFKTKNPELNLENLSELQALSEKWNIALNDLTRAIVETGSTNVSYLKSYIKNSAKNKKCTSIWIYQGMRIIR